MPVSNKLTLLVLVLPSIFLFSVFGVGFYLYRNSFDTLVFSTAVSNFTSSIVVLLLVWERLRDSVLKKLGYMQRNILSGLSKEFTPSQNVFREKIDTKRLRVDLEKYGKFIHFSLYPRGSLSKIDEYLLMHGEFYKRWRQIYAIVNKQIPNFSEYDFAQYLGLDLNYRARLEGALGEQYTSVSIAIMNDNPKLASELNYYFEKTRKLGQEIFDQLTDFLKSNGIEIESGLRSLYE
jgi:hypothetical protein